MGNVIAATIVLDHEPEGEVDYDNAEAIEAGTTLRGNVSIELQQDIDPTSLALEVHGKERTFGYDKKTQQLLDDKHTIFQTELKLFSKPKRKIQAKTYFLPFEVALPSTLPSSCSYFHEGGETGFQIEYTVKLKTKAKGKWPNKRSFNVRAKPLAGKAVPCMVQPTGMELQAMGIVWPNAVSLGANVENVNVGKGGRLDISLACQNHSSIGIDRIQVELVEEYLWISKSAGTEAGELLVLKENVKLPSLRRAAIPRDEVRDLSQEELDQVARHMYSILQSPRNVLSINIPETARCSYRGTTVSISHSILVTLCSRASNPSTRIPIKIGEPFDDMPMPKNESENATNDEEEEASLGTLEEHGSMENPESKDDGKPAEVVAQLQSIPGSISKTSLSLDDSSVMDMSVLSLPAPGEFGEPSVQALLDEMEDGLNGMSILESKMGDMEWAILLGSLTPQEFGAIIKNLKDEFEQPRVGKFLARHIGSTFTCAHCVAAVKRTASSLRANMVRALLPFCSDLAKRHQSIRKELSSYEQIIVTMSALGDEHDSSRAVPDATATTNTQSVGEESLQDGSIQPNHMDICMNNDGHEGTMDFSKIVQESSEKFPHERFSPLVYQWIMRQVQGRRFLTQPFGEKMPLYWREATQQEMIEFVGGSFDQCVKNFRSDRTPAQKRQSVIDNLPRSDWQAGGEEENNWRDELSGAKDSWELAVTIHSYHSRAGFDSDEEEDSSIPSQFDVCLDLPKHPGNGSLYRAVRKCLKIYPDKQWSPPVYQALRKQLQGRRFFVGTSKNDWREATQAERIEGVGRTFREEKKSQKDKSTKTKDALARNAALSRKSVTSNRRSFQSHQNPGESVVESSSPRSKTSAIRQSMHRNHVSTPHLIKPLDSDVCFGDDSHSGTVTFGLAVLGAVDDGAEPKWSPPIFKKIRQALQGRRFFVRDNADSPWREATQEERMKAFRQEFNKVHMI